VRRIEVPMALVLALLMFGIVSALFGIVLMLLGAILVGFGVGNLLIAGQGYIGIALLGIYFIVMSVVFGMWNALISTLVWRREI